MIVNMTGVVTKSVAVWMQERLVVLLTGVTTQVKMWTNLSGSSSSPIATYLPANGQVYIDMTDYARTYRNAFTAAYFLADNGNAQQMSVSMAGLINPELIFIPTIGFDKVGALIVPPMHMLHTDVGVDVWAELFATSGYSFDQNSEDNTIVNNRMIEIEDDDFTLQTMRGSSVVESRRYLLQRGSCDAEYVHVRWVSFTGATRQHDWQMVKQKTGAVNGYSLLPIDNEYIEIKGRENGFTIMLDGLDEYDYWYYSDLLTSSKVEISFDGDTYYRAQVTTSKVTQPDGNSTDGKLEIELNWRKYDAVAV